MKVLVGGATGHIGGHVMAGLREKGYWVRALGRPCEKEILESREYDDAFVGEATQAETMKGAH